MPNLNDKCPCTLDCVRHGDCQACKAYHRRMGDLTACEIDAAKKDGDSPERALPDAKTIRLMDFAACAG